MSAYTNNDKMPWGKHKGLIFKFLPSGYLQWLAGNCDWDDDVQEIAEWELARRDRENDHTWRDG